MQTRVKHPVIAFMAATLDGVVAGTGAVYEAKFMLPWSFSEEAAAEKYMAQLQHNMWVTNARMAALSIITGGGKWVEISIAADPLYQHLLLTAEKKFWRCVRFGEPPRLFGVEPPRPRIEAVRSVDMASSNTWAEFAALFCSTRSAFLDHETGQERAQGPDAGGRQGGVRPWGPGQALQGGGGQLRGGCEKRRPAMHRSSESIAALAAALAKAQMVLTNPEKSLTGTLPGARPDEPGRTFRYASLSAGLDIVRKVLGQHEIATLQTTVIDQDIQTVSLTTVLAHASGEWIASDWPVCTLSDMASPRRMGAALTYARRYALFTLVGIAGEDDLDAPDLAGQPAEGAPKAGNGFDQGKVNGSGAAGTLGAFARNRKPWTPPKQALAPEASATLRDRLVGELTGLASADEATMWAQRALGAKNTLRDVDAAVVEVAFASRMTFASTPCGGCTMPARVFPAGASSARNISSGAGWRADSRANARTSFWPVNSTGSAAARRRPNSCAWRDLWNCSLTTRRRS